jgi:hypothetical protein
MAVLDYLLEQLDEKKDHIIKKIPALSDEQKTEIISFFKKHPNYEKNIDWNKSRSLTYDDFKKVLSTVSKSGQMKDVKVKGIDGLRKGKDYLDFPLNQKDVKGYIPLNHRSSAAIGSKNIGACDTKWCTAMSNTDKHWESEVMNTNAMLLYLLYPDTKYAVLMYPQNKSYEIYNANDDKVKSLPGIDIENDILSRPEIFDRARSVVKTPMHKRENIVKGLRSDDLSVVKQLIPSGSEIPDDVNTGDSIKFGTPHTLDYLRKNTNYKFPKDPLYAAILMNNYDVLRYLLFSGVKPTERDRDMAELGGSDDMVKVIDHVMKK